MIYPVKVFDKKGNLKRVISKTELEERFWHPETLKSRGNRNSHFFALKDRSPTGAELDNRLTHGIFHPKIS